MESRVVDHRVASEETRGGMRRDRKADVVETGCECGDETSRRRVEVEEFRSDEWERKEKHGPLLAGF